MLEELGLPYTVIPVNIRAGEQFKPEFLDEEARKNMFGQRAKEMAGRK
jgi:glutathione S-transferase